MKINPLVSDILRGPWLVNPAAVYQHEQVVNNYLLGNYKGEAIDRKEIFASTSADGSMGNLKPGKAKRLVKIPMRGVLAANGDMCMLGADDYLEWFREVNEDDAVSAVILDVDGPGSSVSAINYMKEFAAEKKKPFIGLANTAFSGHYWTLSLLCDHIMAYGDISSEFGSIGVLSMVMDARKAMEKEGYKVMIVRAPQSSTKAQQAKDFYDGKDEDFIKAMEADMFPMAESFIADIKALRPKVDVNAPGIFTGSTFNAKDALRYGLIDSIGNEKQAIEIAQVLSELYNN